MRLINGNQAKELDRLSEQMGVATAKLMQKAGEAVAKELQARADPKEGCVIFFVGKGNNGGDAKVAAEILGKKGYSCVAIPFESNLKAFSKDIQRASWIVDGLLGTGLKGEPQGWMKEAILCINQSGKKVLSIDIPSGISCDKGIPLGFCVRASVTICLGGVKLGAFLHPGCEYAGEIVSADIGIPRKAYEKISFPYRATEVQDFKGFLKKRPLGSHKGDFGHVLVVAGSQEMPGAGFLAAQAALRSGAGLVTYCLPFQAYKKFDPKYAEVMVSAVLDDDKGFFTPRSVEETLKLCEKKNAVVLGPGLGRKKETLSFVQAFVQKLKLPLVLDADGLFAISSAAGILKERKGPTILTPHAGEMAFLMGWQTEEILKAKVQVALEGSFLWKVILILKGYRTLIAFPGGRLFVNPTGNPGMATAGMGDVLAGILGSLLVQGLSADTAALAGVYLHGLAGDLCKEKFGEKGLIASDVSSYVPLALKAIESV